jgi:DNA-binding transcriptional ArsR family regulator
MMAPTADRIRRLLTEQLSECCDADVERRLDELDALAEAAFAADDARPLFAVLGNETRYRLARALVAADDERCVCELEPLVDVSESAVSHALSDRQRRIAPGDCRRGGDGVSDDLGVLDRYLTVWIGLAMLAGVAYSD